MTGALGRDFVGQVIAYLICAPLNAPVPFFTLPFSVSFFYPLVEYIKRHFLLIMRRCLSARESAAKKFSPALEAPLVSPPRENL